MKKVPVSAVLRKRITIETPQQQHQHNTITTGAHTTTTTTTNNFINTTCSLSKYPHCQITYDNSADKIFGITTGLESEALIALKKAEELLNENKAAVATSVSTSTKPAANATTLNLSESSKEELIETKTHSMNNSNSNSNNMQLNKESNEEFWWRNEALVNANNNKNNYKNSNTNALTPARYTRSRSNSIKNKTIMNVYKTHMISDVIDVLIRIGVVITFSKLEVSTSFKRFIQLDELWMYKYPRTEDYVGVQMLLVNVIAVPFLVTLLQLWWSSDFRDFRAANWVWTGALCLNGIVTSLLKITVGRPRPDFFYRCYPNGQMPLNATIENTNILNISTCTGNLRLINEGFKSFPSGHASFAFVGYGFITFYIGAKLHAFSARGRGETWRLYLAITPLLIAIMVAVSRTCDYHHHWQDVLVGSILGFSICYYTYRQYYPSVFADDCHKPLSRSSRRFSLAYRNTQLNRYVNKTSTFDMDANKVNNTTNNINNNNNIVAEDNDIDDEDDESIFEANSSYVNDKENRPLISEKVDPNNKLTARNKFI